MVKNRYKKLLLVIKGRSPNFCSVLKKISDARYTFYESRSNSSYIMVITPIVPYLPLLGMKWWLKINTNIFNGFRKGLNICLDTNFMNPG